MTTTKVEETKRIDIRVLKNRGSLKPYTQGQLSWNCDGEPSGSINFSMFPDRMELSYRARAYWEDDWRQIKQTIQFTFTSCNYGGRRYWFQCPGCYNRVAVLCAPDEGFYCRKCYGLSYACQSENLEERVERRMNKIEFRFFDDEGDFFYPKKGMHKKTFDREYAKWSRLNDISNSMLGWRLRRFF